MKKYYFLIIVALILGLVLTGCSLLSNISQVPATEQSSVTSLTKGDFDVECPAAPAVAGLLLEAVGLDNRYGTGKNGGNFIADVAKEMGPETDFHGVGKCNIENYRIEIAKFLILKGATEVGLLFQAELESVVYEGTCNTFGTQAGETMTFTFSNNVVLDPTIIPHTTPIVYFGGGISAIGTGPLNWTAVGNEVIITTTGAFSTPRPDVGDIVNNLAGIVDVLGNVVTVPAGGVEIDGIVTYDLLGGWMMDLYVSEIAFKARFVVIETFEDGEITGFLGTGYDTAGAAAGNITGTVDGQLISMLYDRVGHETTGYEAYFEGTIEDCDFISGTWTDNKSYLTDHNWEMYRTY